MCIKRINNALCCLYSQFIIELNLYVFYDMHMQSTYKILDMAPPPRKRKSQAVVKKPGETRGRPVKSTLDISRTQRLLGPVQNVNDVYERVYRFCVLGMSNAQIAEHYCLSLDQFERFLVATPEAMRAINDGREYSHANVAMAMNKRALGYTHKVTKVTQFQGEVFQTVIDEDVAPDVAAQIFILKNRQPDLWKDRREITGAGGQPLAVELSWLQDRQVTIEAEDVRDNLTTISGPDSAHS